MSCNIGEAMERLENDLLLHLRYNLFSNPSVALPMSQLICQSFHCFTYATDHSATLLLLLLTSPGNDDACTSGISRVLTVASLQRLKEEAHPAPAECAVWSVIKFLNAQSIAPIEIHRELCQSMATHGSTVNTSPAGVRLEDV